MRFVLRTIAAAAISIIVKEDLTRDTRPSLNETKQGRNAKKVN